MFMKGSMLLNIAITFYLIVLWKKVSIVAILDVYLSESTLFSAHWPTVIMCLMSANYSLLLSPASHHNEQRMNLLIGSSKLHEAWLLFVRKPIMSFINVSASGLFNQEIDISSARSSLDLITICSDQYFFSLACLEAYFLSSLDLKISAKFTSYRQYGTPPYIWNVKSWKKEGARFTTLCFCVTQSGLKIWCKLGRLKKLCKKNINVNMSQD